MGMSWDNKAPTERELDMIEQVAILEMMPARYQQAYQTIEANRNILNKLYQACTYHMSNWTRSKIVELRRELQSVNIYVQRLKVERGAIIVPYKSRYIAGSLTIEPDDAERQIKILIGDYSQLVFGRRPD